MFRLKIRSITIIVFLFFFVFELITLSHYGVDLDTINHLPRGQAYLHFFLTGQKNYKNFSEYTEYYQKENTIFFSPDKPKNTIPKRSIYQIDDYSASYFFKKDGGHPPLTDILASIFNVIFFQKLRLINDIDSYHLYIILSASILVGAIFWWSKKRLGFFPAIVSILSLILYPLFLSESHFNLKDIPETTFYSLTLISFYEGLVQKKIRFLIAAGVFSGLALGTKFNIFFCAISILLFLVLFFWKNRNQIRDYYPLWWSLALIPFIAGGIFFFTWPYLWQNPLQRFFEIVTYYKTIGINPSFDRNYIFLFFNTYALQWILYTTPIVTLVFSGAGILYAILKGFKEKHKTTLFILLWFLVPVARVTMPHAGIYGGVRQIMEYIPAMAILSGIGALWLRSFLLTLIPQKKIISVFFIIVFIPITLKLISIHPNENVYFNPLIGGLRGAKEKNILYWGNSFGNLYRQGVRFVNTHAEKDSTLVLAQELMPNLPRVLVRNDLHYGNNLRSGYLRKGEYVIGLEYGFAGNQSYYSSQYYNAYLEPTYQIKVDGISILNVWKNDYSHTKKGFLAESKIFKPQYKTTNRGILIDLKKSLFLSKIEWDFSESNCKEVKQIFFMVSVDGDSWYKTPHVLPEDLPIPIQERQPTGNTVFYPFAAEQARYIYIIVEPEESCVKRMQNLTISYLPNVSKP